MAQPVPGPSNRQEIHIVSEDFDADGSGQRDLVQALVDQTDDDDDSTSRTNATNTV